MAREKAKQVELRARLNETNDLDRTIYPKKHDTPDAEALSDQHQPSQQGNNQTLIDDKQYIWETIAQKSLILSPHTPYCDLAASIFANAADKASNSDLFKLYCI